MRSYSLDKEEDTKNDCFINKVKPHKLSTVLIKRNENRKGYFTSDVTVYQHAISRKENFHNVFPSIIKHKKVANEKTLSAIQNLKNSDSLSDFLKNTPNGKNIQRILNRI